MNARNRELLTSSHWGTYQVAVKNGKVVSLQNFSEDPDPSPIGQGILDVLDGPTRITTPMARKSWLEDGPGSGGDLRGNDEFVELSWDQANQIVADELTRIRSEFAWCIRRGGQDT